MFYVYEEKKVNKGTFLVQDLVQDSSIPKPMEVAKCYQNVRNFEEMKTLNFTNLSIYWAVLWTADLFKYINASSLIGSMFQEELNSGSCAKKKKDRQRAMDLSGVFPVAFQQLISITFVTIYIDLLYELMIILNA